MGDCQSCETAAGHCPGVKDESCIVEETIATVLTTLDLDDVIERAALLLRRHFGHTRVVISRLLANGEAMEVMIVDDPLQPTPDGKVRIPLAGTAAGLAVASGERQVLDELDPSSPRVAEERMLGELGYGALAVFPLIADGKVLGVLEIAHPPRCGLIDHCVMVAERVAQLLAIALQNSSLMREVRRLNGVLQRENRYLKDRVERYGSVYVAEGPLMREVMSKVELVAPSDSTVLIRGETGTGKEGLARLVHELSHRKSGPFVTVNLGAIPETLIESELFGHEKGAFTGAVRRRAGRFELAAGGTIFLDEVGDAPLPVQVRLLRVLQERTIERVGGEASIPVDVRVVAATNRPLESLIEQERFRSDLYYRLSTFPVHLPPLRQRRDDLRPLVEHLLAKHAARMHRRPPAVPEATWSALANHDWPGNVRELENFLERALILCPGGELTLKQAPGGPPEVTAAARVAADELTVGEVLPFDASVRAVLERAMEATSGKIYGEDGAAARLGLKPTTLQGKLRKYGLR